VRGGGRGARDAAAMRDERKRGGNYPSELFARCNCENRYQNTAQLRLRLRLRLRARARSLAFSVAAVVSCVWRRAHARVKRSQCEREETRGKR